MRGNQTKWNAVERVIISFRFVTNTFLNHKRDTGSLKTRELKVMMIVIMILKNLTPVGRERCFTPFNAGRIACAIKQHAASSNALTKVGIGFYMCWSMVLKRKPI